MYPTIKGAILPVLLSIFSSTVVAFSLPDALVSYTAGFAKDIPQVFTPVKTEGFSWRAQLGMPAAVFYLTTGSFADCKAAALLDYVLTTSPKKFTPGAWHAPFGGGLVETKTSRVIENIVCVTKQNVRIKAFSHAGAVFKIVLEYPRCAAHATLVPADCDFNQKEYDLVISKNLSDSPFYGPSSDVDNREAKRYFEMKAQIADDYLSEKVSAAAWCTGAVVHIFDRNKQGVRCMFETRQSEGIWHSLSVSELIEKGWFSNTVLARLAARQEFALIEAEKKAIAAFETELMIILEEKRGAEATRLRREEENLKALQSVR